MYAIDKPYDYLVPAALEERAKSGVRVTVPFASRLTVRAQTSRTRYQSPAGSRAFTAS